VLNLRRKAAVYGLEIFFDAAVGGSKAREHYKTEDDLASLKDSVLLDTCRKAGANLRHDQQEAQAYPRYSERHRHLASDQLCYQRL
jgi:hypothetical protein